MSQPFRLYVWFKFFPDYTYGMAFAIARNEKEAEEAVKKDTDPGTWNWGPVEVFDLDDAPIGFGCAGGG